MSVSTIDLLQSVAERYEKCISVAKILTPYSEKIFSQLPEDILSEVNNTVTNIWNALAHQISETIIEGKELFYTSYLRREHRNKESDAVVNTLKDRNIPVKLVLDCLGQAQENLLQLESLLR